MCASSVRSEYDVPPNEDDSSWVKQIARARQRVETANDMPRLLFWLGPLGLVWLGLSAICTVLASTLIGFPNSRSVASDRHTCSSRYGGARPSSVSHPGGERSCGDCPRYRCHVATPLPSTDASTLRKARFEGRRRHRAPSLHRWTAGPLGHSQGSVLAYLTALRLPHDTRRSTILVTCGSPLGPLYRTSSLPTSSKPTSTNCGLGTHKVGDGSTFIEIRTQSGVRSSTRLPSGYLKHHRGRPIEVTSSGRRFTQTIGRALIK